MADTDIIDIIASHAGQGQTGTVMAVFADNSIGRFYIVGGMPATARYRNRQGQAAMDLAMQTNVQSSTFHEEADLVRSGEMLNGTAMPASSRPAAAQPAAAQPVIPPGQALTGVMRSSLEDVLSEFIGPVAPLIVADLPASISIDNAISRLAAEISDPGQSSEFVRAARTVTGKKG